MLIAAGSNVPRYYGSAHVTNYYYVVLYLFLKSAGQFCNYLTTSENEIETSLFHFFKILKI